MINRDYSWNKQGGVLKRKMDLISVNIIRVSACKSGIIIWTYTISVNPGEFVAWDRKVYNQVILGPGIWANKQISEKGTSLCLMLELLYYFSIKMLISKAHFKN